MKINYKLRLQSKTFWVALIASLVLLTQQMGIEIFPSNIMDITNTMLTIAVILGIINDPTTEGISDSGKALEYQNLAPNINNKGV